MLGLRTGQWRFFGAVFSLENKTLSPCFMTEIKSYGNPSVPSALVVVTVGSTGSESVP